MHDIERKRNEDIRKSEAVPHYKSEEDMRAEKSPDGYESARDEKAERTRPREMLAMGNSYGNVSVAANRKKEMTLVVNEIRRHDSPTLQKDQKQLSAEHRRASFHSMGSSLTNSLDPIHSAFALKTRKLQPEKKVLGRIQTHVDTKGQDTVEKTLPFFTLANDRALLRTLESESRKAKEEGRDFDDIDQDKDRLYESITLKEQMQSRFLQKLRLALIKSKAVMSGDYTVQPQQHRTDESDESEELPNGDKPEEDVSSGKNLPHR